MELSFARLIVVSTKEKQARGQSYVENILICFTHGKSGPLFFVFIVIEFYMLQEREWK